MGFNGYKVVDMDSHIREYVDLDRTYKEHIDPGYRESFELLSSAVARRRERGLTTALFMNPQAIIAPSDESRPLGVYDTFGLEQGTGVARDRGAEIPREVHWEPSIRLRDMDRAGIDISVIFASQANGYCALSDVGFETALHRAYHRYMTAYCEEADGRLRWVSMSNMRDIPATVAELTYWAERDTNMVGMLISPVCPGGRLLDNPDLHPLYQRAQDLDLPLLVHGGVLRPPYTPGATELNNAGFMIRAVYHPWSGMTAVGALTGGGAFDLFPKLRVAVFEAGAGWMPWLFEQLDNAYESRPHLVPNLRRKPSDVLAEGRLFHSVDTGERYLEHCVQELGEDIWVMGTDYPHPGTSFPDGVAEIVERAGLAETAKHKILWTNPLRLSPRLAE